jgi:AraC family transcriptional regulator, exoenzyme S synthesis regulatory protein ExsA
VINYYQGARTNTKVFKQLFCKDLLFAYYDCPLGCTREDRWSQYNYILYIITGKKILSTNTGSWSLSKGTAVFVKKGACIIEEVNGEVLSLMVFFIPDSYLRSFLSQNIALSIKEKINTHGNELVLSLEVNEMMLAYYESLIPYFFSSVKPPEYLLELKFKELLYNIIGNPANTEFNSFLHTLISSPANNIRPVIEANYCYNLTLSEYAQLCNRSLSSFKRDFYSLYGESPARWLLIKRLAHSLELLCNSNSPIVDISYKSGFENSTHFSHAFKKHFGISPLSYRQKYSRVER